jgi:hypothetical protein
MGLLSQHKDEYYAKELEQILVKGMIKETSPEIISFLSREVFPLYITASQEANRPGRQDVKEFYSRHAQSSPSCKDEDLPPEDTNDFETPPYPRFG